MRRRREITVELTPLLDVILIMLFLIMSQSSEAAEQTKQEAEQKVSNMECQVEDLRETNAELESRLDSYAAFDEYARIISIDISNKTDGNRMIIVSDGEHTERIEFDWESMRYGENSLRAELIKSIDAWKDMPVFIVFNYDSSGIYRRDYEMITSVIDTIEYENVYIKYNER